MPWESIGQLNNLAPGQTAQIAREGKEYIVCRVEEEVFVLDNECPHAGGPLAMGTFSPPVITCPFHAWEFDCRTGQCIHNANVAVRRYPVVVRGSEIFAEFPEEP